LNNFTGKKVKKKKTKKTRKPAKQAAPDFQAAYKHFGLTSDPFTTLSLQAHNLDYFVGRKALLDRMSSALFSLSNVGVAGEPGVGKSSLMQMLRNRVPSGFYCVGIGVPRDDASYFLSELLREILVVIPRVPGLSLKEVGRRLETGDLHKNAVLFVIKTIASRLEKPLLVFVDDLEKIKGDRIQHLTRSERTQQLLEELKPLLEMPRTAFVIALQEEFYAKIGLVVKENAEPSVLGLFKHVVLVEKFSHSALKEALALRLKQAGFKGEIGDFLEPEALTLALSMSSGNPRRFFYLLSESMYHGFQRKGKRVEFQDLFEAVNEHYKLDMIYKKLLFFLAKSGKAVATNPDLQSFMGLDMISIARRLEMLSKNQLAEMVDVADGMRVYSLPGAQEGAALAYLQRQAKTVPPPPDASPNTPNTEIGGIQP
jgi:hypothetical protein